MIPDVSRSPEIAAIFAAWDKTDGEGRDDALTRSLSTDYVEAHPDEFKKLSTMSENALVAAIDVFREAGWEDDVDNCQIMLWHKYEPRNIGGVMQSVLRFPEPSA